MAIYNSTASIIKTLSSPKPAPAPSKPVYQSKPTFVAPKSNPAPIKTSAPAAIQKAVQNIFKPSTPAPSQPSYQSKPSFSAPSSSPSRPSPAPAPKVSTPSVNNIKTPTPVAPAVKSYTVKQGDTLSDIAQRYNVPLSSISGYKSGNPNLILPGESLSIGSAKDYKPMNNPTMTQATTQAIKSGASASLLDKARQYLGEKAYIGLCQAFVEKTTQGREGIYRSAIDAWNNQINKAQNNMANIRPGDAVYFAPDGSNGNYGHTGVYAGNGQFISATYNGVQQYDLNDWIRETGQKLLGFIPSNDNPGILNMLATGANAIQDQFNKFTNSSTPKPQSQPKPLNTNPMDWVKQQMQEVSNFVAPKAYASDRVSLPGITSAANITSKNPYQDAQDALLKLKMDQVKKEYELKQLQAKQKEEEKQKKAMNTVAQKVISVVPEQARGAAQQNLPLIIDALKNEGILTPQALAYALATIQHETAGTFEPIPEYMGREQAQRLGYSGGENYYGRGFIQLTHDYNYRDMGQRIGMGDQLLRNPDLAMQPDVAAKILAAFMKDRGVADRANQNDFVGARQPINGYDKAWDVANYAKQYLSQLPSNLGQ